MSVFTQCAFKRLRSRQGIEIEKKYLRVNERQSASKSARFQTHWWWMETCVLEIAFVRTSDGRSRRLGRRRKR